MPIGLVGSDFQVNNSSVGSPNSGVIAALSGGGFAVTWQASALQPVGDGHVFATVLSPNGNGDFVVDDNAPGYNAAPDIAALANGRFVVTWIDFADGDFADSFRARIFESDGTPVAGEFVVHSPATTEYQSPPEVTTLSDGRFVVTWESSSGGDSSTYLRARVFDATGTPTGNEFAVNETASNSQAYHDVTALSGGRFLVTWESTDGGDGSGDASVHACLTRTALRPAAAL